MIQQQADDLTTTTSKVRTIYLLLTYLLIQTLTFPPAVDSKLITKAQKHEYVDFDTLLPAPPSIITTDDNTFGFDLDSESNILIRPNKPRGKITDFNGWMCALECLYSTSPYAATQTCTSNCSHTSKTFCNFTRKFKFTHCYMYDKALRKQIATQTSLPFSTRTAFWHISKR